MKEVVLVGIGKESIPVVREAVSKYDSTDDFTISAIVFAEKEMQDQFIGSHQIKTVDDLVVMSYDILVVCAPFPDTKKVITFFREKFRLPADRCFGFQKPRIGEHQIDWTQVYDRTDIMAQLRNMPEKLNDLEKFFLSGDHRVIYKWMHYFEVYERHFSKYRGKKPVVMEIGVFKGGSLQMWKDYFGEGAEIIGIDIDESVKAFEEEGIKIEIGSQEDREFLGYLRQKYPKIDILIDDGGHTMNQQIVTFEELFTHISENGCYLCEDMHTSYWSEYGGGYRDPGSYIEYSKNFIDYLNAWYTAEIGDNGYTRSMHSLHYYDSILVIEKRKMGYPMDFQSPE